MKYFLDVDHGYDGQENFTFDTLKEAGLEVEKQLKSGVELKDITLIKGKLLTITPVEIVMSVKIED